MAPAALAPPQWRAIAYGGALASAPRSARFRVAAGAHFFSDVVFAGVLIYLVVWTAHGLIYRWPATRWMRGRSRIGSAKRASACRGLARRLAGDAKEHPDEAVLARKRPAPGQSAPAYSPRRNTERR